MFDKLRQILSNFRTRMSKDYYMNVEYEYFYDDVCANVVNCYDFNKEVIGVLESTLGEMAIKVENLEQRVQELEQKVENLKSSGGGED